MALRIEQSFKLGPALASCQIEKMLGTCAYTLSQSCAVWRARAQMCKARTACRFCCALTHKMERQITQGLKLFGCIEGMRTGGEQAGDITVRLMFACGRNLEKRRDNAGMAERR